MLCCSACGCLHAPHRCTARRSRLSAPHRSTSPRVGTVIAGANLVLIMLGRGSLIQRSGSHDATAERRGSADDRTGSDISQPTIKCPSCSTEIKLTESLAAPLIQATRQEYETKIALKEREVSIRESALRDQQRVVEEARNTIDEQVAEKLRSERKGIATEEARKARLAAADELEAKGRELV
jgi:hypothetical protein